jgi:hypothetical protein
VVRSNKCTFEVSICKSLLHPLCVNKTNGGHNDVTTTNVLWYSGY